MSLLAHATIGVSSVSCSVIASFTAIYDHNNRPVKALGDLALYLDENPTMTIN